MSVKSSLKKVLPLPAKSTRQEFSKVRRELDDAHNALEALGAAAESARATAETARSVQDERIERLGKRLADADAELRAEVEGRFETQEALVRNVREEIGRDLDRLRSEIADEAGRVRSDASARGGEFNKALSTLESELDSLKSSLAELERGQKSREASLQALRSDVSHISSQVSALGPRFWESKRAVVGSAAATMKRSLIEHLDYHLVDHCNLNCTCCSTYSPLADKVFADPQDFRRDLERLRTIVGDSVLRLHLLGGEPLLHPDVEEFVRIARSVFSDARIDVTTNGLLVADMPDSFWTAMRECSVDLKYTRYPVKLDYDAMVEFAREKGVFAFSAGEGTIKCFRRIPLNAKGVFNIHQTYLQCPYIDCPQLRDGKLYRCPASAYSDILNKAMEEADQIGRFHVTRRDYLDLEQIDSSEEVFEFLSGAIPFCQYCDMGHVDNNVAWGGSSRDIREWVDL